MSAQIRQPRARGGGGRTLMLLGVILALAAGIMVIYVVTTAGPATTHQVTVVVAAKDLTSGTILTAGEGDASHTTISDAFISKQVNSDFVPQGAYVYTSPTQLSTYLNDQIVTGQFFAGDILRAADPRLAKLGTVTSGSLTFRNPPALPKGSVLYPLTVENIDGLGLVGGDHVDVLVTFCNVPGLNTSSLAGCSTQTTLENVYIYAVNKGILYVVLTHQDALTLKVLSENSKVTLAIRKPGDTDPANTTPVTGPYIFSHFHFTP